MPPPTLEAGDAQAVSALLEGSPDEAALRLAERLVDQIVALMTADASKPSQQSVALLTAFMKDTIAFILQTQKTRGALTATQVVNHVLAKNQHLMQAVGFDHAACGLAVAHLATTVATTVPVAAMQTQALIVTAGIAGFSGGLGVPFVLGSLALLGLSGLSIYLSATQTAEVCSATLSEVADRYGQARHGLTAPGALRTPARATQRLRCELPVKQVPTQVLGLLDAALKREAFAPRLTPRR